MAQIIGHLGGGAMIVFVVLLALRCLVQMNWLPAKGIWIKRLGREDSVCQPNAFSQREYAMVFAGALLLQWTVLFAAWLTLNQPGGLPQFLEHFQSRFTQAGDSPHYLSIAQNGYLPTGEAAKYIVFYPLYPLLIRLAGIFTGGNLPLAGLLVSQLCWGASCVMLLRLASCWLSRENAVWAAAFMMVYPFAFFGMGIYTESLFLLLCISCVYQAVCRCWGVAGLLGGLAALCRTQGLVMLLVVLWLLMRAQKEKKQGLKSLGILLIPAGWAVYLGCNYVVFGNCFAFLEFEAAPPWYQTTCWIAENLTQHCQMAVDNPGLANFIYWPQLAFYFIILGLLFWGLWQGVRTEWLIWGGAYLGMSYLAGWMISGPRYMLGCIPLFLLMARIPSKKVRTVLLIVSFLAQSSYTALFMQGQAIM